MATTPAICGLVLVPQFPEPGQTWVDVGGVLAKSAPIVLKSGPAEAVLTLLVIVLLMMSTAVESRSEIPPPSQPATLSDMILLVTVTVFHCLGFLGKATISTPLTPWKATPPPFPAPPASTILRLALLPNPA